MTPIQYLLEYNRYMNIVGIFAILGIAWIFSHNRSRINYKLVGFGLLLQSLIGFFVLKTNTGQRLVSMLAFAVGKLYQFADEGTGFVFGNLSNADAPWGFIFAIKVLPVIIFFGAFMGLLFHFNIVQTVVSLVSWTIRPLLGTSGAETLCAIANSFLGQTEAPLLIRHYLNDMTKSEILLVMISGMATISGAILVVFVAMGVPASHLLASSVMSIPASIVIAKILYPQTEIPVTKAGAVAHQESTSKNVFDAIATGTIDGLQLALNVGAMLISFLALLALANYAIGYTGLKINYVIVWLNDLFATRSIPWQISWRIPQLSIELIFSYAFSPFGYFFGFTGQEALAAGQLIGTKVAVNELIAYSKMVNMGLSDRAMNILTYALCGFSNFSCIGIQLGGIGALVPEKRVWLSQFGLLAVLGGTLANLLTAMIASLLL